MNEETMIMRGNNVDANEIQQESKKGWKKVAFGGITGIVVGAGAMYATSAFANNETEAESQEGNAETQQAKETEVSNGVSFTDAFNAAREAVGPGGIFHWNGNVYSTYTSEEWDAMTEEQKQDFANSVPSEKPAIDEAQPIVVVVETPSTPEPVVQAVDLESETHTHPNLQGFEAGEDVRIVGYTEVEGHVAVGYDFDGDSQIDVALIDMDNSGDISAPDVLVDSEGNMSTIEEVNSGYDQSYAQSAVCENPEVANGEPDYVNDANTDFMQEA